MLLKNVIVPSSDGTITFMVQFPLAM